MSKRKWYTRAIYSMVALAFVAGLALVPAAPASADDPTAGAQVPGCLSEWGNANAEWDDTVANVYYDTPAGGSAAKLTDGTSTPWYQQAAVLMCYDDDLASLDPATNANYKYWIKTAGGHALAAVIHVDTDADGDVDVILHSTNIPCGDNVAYAADAPTNNWAAFNVNFSNPLQPFTGMGMWWKDGSGYTEPNAGTATYKPLAGWAVGGIDQTDAVLYVGAATVGSYGPDVWYVDGIDITGANQYDLEPVGCGPEYVLVPDITDKDTTIAYNVKTADETFTVIDYDTGVAVPGCFVSNWQVTKRCGIGGVTTLAGGNNGDNFVTVRMDTKGDCIITADVCGIPSAVNAEKKWGQIYCTKLESVKYATNIYDVTETVTGSFLWEDCTAIEHMVVDGAVVDWWLMDISAQPAIEALEAALGADPCDADGGCGTYVPDFFSYDIDGLLGIELDEVFDSPRDALEAMYDESSYWVVGASTITDPVVDPDPTHEQTVSGVDGKTAVEVTLASPTSAILVTLTDYPIDLSGENPVCVQHETWIVIPPPVIEKLPNILWAGEKDVVEWRLPEGTDLTSVVVFYLEDPSVGTFEALVSGFGVPPWPGFAIRDTAWGLVEAVDCPTCGAYYAARTVLHSDKQGKSNVIAVLYDYDGYDYTLVAQQGFLVYFLAFEDVELKNIEEDPTNDEAWESAGDELGDLFLDNSSKLRLRVKGWFEDPVMTSPRAAKPQDLDGDGMTDIILPAGRWVLPDDYPTLALGKLLWDMMDTPVDNIVSELDSNADKIETLGPYGDAACFEYVLADTTLTDAEAKAAYLEALVACYPVIGPFSKLQAVNADGTAWDLCDITWAGRVPDMLSEVPADGNPIDALVDPLDGALSESCRVTVVPDGSITEEDANMPPAEILFAITAGNGLLADVNKADLYQIPETCNTDTGVVYTNPYYWQEIPANLIIPPMYGSGLAGYEWDSWGWGTDTTIDGPYRFWDALDLWTSDQLILMDILDLTAVPTALKAYTDNHGEAWVEFTQKSFVSSTIKAVATYPYLIGDHLPLVSNPVVKISEDFKDPKVAWEKIDDMYDMLYVFVRDYDGDPAVCEPVDWNIDGIAGTIISLLTDTAGPCDNDCLDITCEGSIAADSRSAQSCTRAMTSTEITKFTGATISVPLDRFHRQIGEPGELLFDPEADTPELPVDYAIAGIKVSSSLGDPVDIIIKIHDCWGDVEVVIDEDQILYFGNVVTGPVEWTCPIGSEPLIAPNPGAGRPFLSVDADPTGITVDPVTAELWGIYYLDETTGVWSYYIPGFASTLTLLEPDKYYYVVVSGACTLTIPQA